MTSNGLVPRHFKSHAGWLKLWRRVYDHDLWLTCPEAWFRVFLAIIGNAAYEPTVFRIGESELPVPVGSLVIGSDEFSKFCRVTRNQLRSALAYLSSTNVITTQTTSRYTLVSVLNWDTYQGNGTEDHQPDHQPNPQWTRSGPAVDPQSGTTVEEIKNRRIQETTTTTPPTPSTEGALFQVKTARKPSREKRSTEQIVRALGSTRLAWWLEFWNIFPCHDGKRAGMDAFERRVDSEDLWLKVKTGAVWYAEKAKARPEMALKYAQGWINDERWNDEGTVSTALVVTPRPNGTNGLTFAERNAQIRNDMFRQMTLQKLQEKGQ
jgi:hypothetical protein